MDGGAEIGNSGRRGLYRADQLARAAVHALSSHLTSPVPLSVRQSWLSRARRTHSQALHPAQLRMGLAALARGERRMMPLGMLPYLLWPTRTALQARCRDRLARDLRRHLLCTVGVLYGCGTTRATRGAPSARVATRSIVYKYSLRLWYANAIRTRSSSQIFDLSKKRTFSGCNAGSLHGRPYSPQA